MITYLANGRVWYRKRRRIAYIKSFTDWAGRSLRINKRKHPVVYNP